MDPQLVQRTRYLLQARVRRTKTCPSRLFLVSCAHLLEWLEGHPIYAPLLRALEQTESGFTEQVRLLRHNLRNRLSTRQTNAYLAASWREHAALCLAGIRLCAAAFKETWSIEHTITGLCSLLSGTFRHELDDALSTVRDVCVDGLYEYLDEQLDTRNAVMGILAKYSKRCMWFHRQRLRAVARDGLEGKLRGERSLAVDLQDYIHDQGIDFSIEQSSASGEADLVLRDVDGSHIVLEAKYIPPESPPSFFKKTLSKGFHQVARYCHDFHEPSGYLVVYVADTKLPRMELKDTDGFQYLEVKGKNVYYIPVPIADGPSASKSGKAEGFDIRLDELISSAEESDEC